MRDDDVPVKTQEGLAEIKTRSLGLAPRMRTALLLVDGAKTVAELEQLLAASGVKPGALANLLEKGLISVPGGHAVNAPAPAPEAEQPPKRDTALAPETAPAPVPAVMAGPASKEPPASGIPASQKALPVAKAAPEHKSPPAAAPKAKHATAPVAKAAPFVNTAPEVPAASAAKAATVAKTAPPPKAEPAIQAKPIPAPAPAADASPTPKPAPGPAAPATRSPAPVSIALPEPAHADEDDDEEEPPAPIFIPPPPPEDMKLLIARAHVANALDDRVDGYVLRQMVANCSSRAELESLLEAAEKVLKKAMGSNHSAQVLGIAKALLRS